MKRFLTLLVLVILCLALGGIAGAGLVNPGFETGDFTGWAVPTGYASVITSIQSYYGGTITAPLGTYCARVTSSPMWTEVGIVQTVSLAAGERINGSALLDDASLSENYAFVRVNGADIFKSDNVGTWLPWSFTAPSAGDYTVALAIARYGSSPIQAFFDAAQPVPLPPAALLLGSGLVGLIGLRRFRK